MSRRFVWLAAVAGLILISGPAIADPECFGPSCKMTPQALMPRVEDPPRLTSEPSAMDATGNLVDVTPPAITEDRSAQPRHNLGSQPEVKVTVNPTVRVVAPNLLAAPEPSSPAERPLLVETVTPPAAPGPAPLVPPLRPAPQMVVDPATRAVPAPRYSADAAPQPPTVVRPRQAERPARVARPAAPAPAPARAVQTVARERAEEPVAPQQVRAVAAYEPVAAMRPAAPVASNHVHVEGSVVVVGYPNAHDPAWERCQADRRGRRPVACGPASYHPYGAGGYRPLGTYRAYATAPAYVGVNPGPRIINIVADER